MSNSSQERDTIFRNIRLITTGWNTFVYLVHPLLAYAWAGYIISGLKKEQRRSLSSRAHVIFAVMVWPVLVMLLALVTSERIKEQLEQDGYVQRRTRAHAVDFAINCAVLGAFMYWARNYEDPVGLERSLLLDVVVVEFLGFMVWSVVIMMSIGPVIWFTVKAR